MMGYIRGLGESIDASRVRKVTTNDEAWLWCLHVAFLDLDS